MSSFSSIPLSAHLDLLGLLATYCIKSFPVFRAPECFEIKMASGTDPEAERIAEDRGGAEAEQAYKAGGAEALRAFVERKLNEWKTIAVNIAVVGQSGAGKSSFINTLRGLENAKDPMFAAVDEKECTMKKKSYPFPDSPLITLWDLPGAGTKEFPAEKYAKEMKFWTYDAFIILSSERFTAIDKAIAEEIQQIKKPFFFARTKMDEVMKNRRRRLKDEFDASSTSDEIREDCRKQLGQGSKIFLIANVPPSELEEDFPEEKFPGIHFDNMDLRVEMTQSLPKMQKTAFGKKP